MWRKGLTEGMRELSDDGKILSVGFSMEKQRYIHLSKVIKVLHSCNLFYINYTTVKLIKRAYLL